jgi:hypothetical protein
VRLAGQAAVRRVGRDHTGAPPPPLPGSWRARSPDDTVLDGRTITLDGQRLLNFGSCSYLGLELARACAKRSVRP